MKKIINGKKYDTETAKMITDSWNGCSKLDFNYEKEELYVKKTGEYFLYGEGGPLSKYAEYNGDSTRGYGKDIIPLSDEKAKTWVEYNRNDLYETIFGEVEE